MKKWRLEAPLLPPSRWPKRARPEAFHGPAGAYVRCLEDHTEADPHAVLAILLTGCGNILGRGPHVVVGRDTHYLNLFVQTVGQSARARKGVAKGDALYALTKIDESWPYPTSGASSGEGVIFSVRDASTETRLSKDKKKRIPKDSGVQDKRLMFIEPEFGAAFRRMKMEANSLSAILRQAWDCDHVLATKTRHSPLTATDAHISLVAQITNQELHALLSETDLFNGFANRFLWVCTQAADHLLPDGGRLPKNKKQELHRHISTLVTAVTNGKRVAELRRTPAAHEYWKPIYERFHSPGPGAFGAATNRADAQVSRLSALYAVLDSQKAIDVAHVASAVAFWDYCEASAKFLFNASTGNAVADRLLTTLRAHPNGGMTRDELRREVFAGHVTKDALTDALSVLRDGGYITVRHESTEGRPRDRVVLR